MHLTPVGLAFLGGSQLLVGSDRSLRVCLSPANLLEQIRLHLREAAIHKPFRSCNVACVVGGEKDVKRLRQRRHERPGQRHPDHDNARNAGITGRNVPDHHKARNTGGSKLHLRRFRERNVDHHTGRSGWGLYADGKSGGAYHGGWADPANGHHSIATKLLPRRDHSKLRFVARKRYLRFQSGRAERGRIGKSRERYAHGEFKREFAGHWAIAAREWPYAFLGGSVLSALRIDWSVDRL
jgi:hypothetical protein